MNSSYIHLCLLLLLCFVCPFIVPMGEVGKTEECNPKKCFRVVGSERLSGVIVE